MGLAAVQPLSIKVTAISDVKATVTDVVAVTEQPETTLDTVEQFCVTGLSALTAERQEI